MSIEPKPIQNTVQTISHRLHAINFEKLYVVCLMINPTQLIKCNRISLTLKSVKYKTEVERKKITFTSSAASTQRNEKERQNEAHRAAFVRWSWMLVTFHSNKRMERKMCILKRDRCTYTAHRHNTNKQISSSMQQINERTQKPERITVCGVCSADVLFLLFVFTYFVCLYLSLIAHTHSEHKNNKNISLDAYLLLY